MTRQFVFGVFLVAVLAVPVGARAQGVVDRTLSTVNGQVILQSDIRQIRLLKLLKTAGSTDDAIQFELENRILMLGELGRTTAEPTGEEKAARRRAWEASLGGGPAVAARLAEAGMSEAGLDAWLRDDVRLEKYLNQRFGNSPDPAGAIATWVQGLRRRAGLPVKGVQRIGF